jgi:hypothetical protein
MASVIPVNPVPIPIGDPISAPRQPFKGGTLADVLQFLRSQDAHGFITLTWQRWLGQQQQTISAGSTRISAVPLAAQSASIGATDFSGGSISGGLYMIPVYARITTAATTGAMTSSLIVAIGWTHGGVVQSFSWPALTGNSVTTVLTGPPITIRVDANSPITYTTTYASDAAGQMQYSLDLVLSRVAA